MFGIDTHIDVVKHHGSTDALILLKVLGHHGVPSEQAAARLPELKQASGWRVARGLGREQGRGAGHRTQGARAGLVCSPAVLQHARALPTRAPCPPTARAGHDRPL